MAIRPHYTARDGCPSPAGCPRPPTATPRALGSEGKGGHRERPGRKLWIAGLLTLSVAKNRCTVARLIVPARSRPAGFFAGVTIMEGQAIGWIAAIIIGGVAGWLAEQFMKSQMGLLMNIVLGIVGALVASWLFSLVGISFGPGWLGYLIAGFIGAVILIFVARAIRGRT